MSCECVNEIAGELTEDVNRVIKKKGFFNLKKTRDKLKSFTGPIGLLFGWMIYTAAGGLVSPEIFKYLFRLGYIHKLLLKIYTIHS